MAEVLSAHPSTHPYPGPPHAPQQAAPVPSDLGPGPALSCHHSTHHFSQHPSLLAHTTPHHLLIQAHLNEGGGERGSSSPWRGSSNPWRGSSSPLSGSSNPWRGSSNPWRGSSNPWYYTVCTSAAQHSVKHGRVTRVLYCTDTTHLSPAGPVCWMSACCALDVHQARWLVPSSSQCAAHEPMTPCLRGGWVTTQVAAPMPQGGLGGGSPARVLPPCLRGCCVLSASS